MEILGKIAGLSRNVGVKGDILISEHKGGYINIVIRNKELFDIDYIVFGFEDDKMYFLDGSMMDIAMRVTKKKYHYIKTKNPRIRAHLIKCVGSYNAKYSRQKKAWYITLKEVK